MSTIKTNDVCLAANTVIYATLSGETVTFVSTEGYLAAECTYPTFVLRDYVAGQPLDFRDDANNTVGPLTPRVRTVVWSKRQSRQYGAPLPDNAPARDGWFIVDFGFRADYHPWASLQLIGISRSQHLILGFSTLTYQAKSPTGTDLRLLLRRIADGGKSCHLTARPAGEFLDWLPAKRIHCDRIREIPDRPDAMGALSPLVDFRGHPDHAAFQAKAVQRLGRSSPDIGN